MNELKENTAIQNEQQHKTRREIVNEIISILAKNELSISDAREILRATSKKLGNQKITSISL